MSRFKPTGFLLAALVALMLVIPAGASAMSYSTANYWANVDAALLRDAHGYSYYYITYLASWGGGWGTYGWTANATFGYPGGDCSKPINLWGASTQEGWNPQPRGYGTCPW